MFCECCGDICACLDNCVSRFCTCCDCICGGLTDFVHNFFIRPFSFCLLYSLGMSLAPLVVVILALANAWSVNCDDPLHIWLMVALGCYIANTIFGFYIYHKADAFQPAAGVRSTPYQRAKNFFLYDVGVCLYMVLTIIQVVWAVLGLMWADTPTTAACPVELHNATKIGAILLLIFFGVGFGLILASLLKSYMEYAQPVVLCWLSCPKHAHSFFHECTFSPCCCCCC